MEESHYDRLINHVEARLFVYTHLTGVPVGNGSNSRRRVAKIAVDAAVDQPFACYMEAEGGSVCIAEKSQEVLWALVQAKTQNDELALQRAWDRAQEVVESTGGI